MVDLQVRAETTDEQAEIVGGPLLGDAFFELTPDQVRRQGWRLAGPLVEGEPVAVLAVNDETEAEAATN